MSGLLLRLAGPMQSWGEHSAFGTRDTLRFPSRSGLIGMIDSARGIRRGHGARGYDEVAFTVRVDRRGSLETDYQTAGGGMPAKRTVVKSEGGYRSSDTATVQSWRHYLADAVFVVAVEGPDNVIAPAAEALRRPHWGPYLGRRAYIPDQPLLLKTGVADPVGALTDQVPLPPRSDAVLDLVTDGEAPPSHAEAEPSRTAVKDVPFPDPAMDGVERSFASRSVAVYRYTAPEGLRTERVAEYRERLRAYVQQEDAA